MSLNILFLMLCPGNMLIDHENALYIGCLFCADVPFCSQVAAALEDNRGRTIKEIGGLDISFTNVKQDWVVTLSGQGFGTARLRLSDICSLNPLLDSIIV